MSTLLTMLLLNAQPIVGAMKFDETAVKSTYWIARILMKLTYRIQELLHCVNSKTAFLWIYSILVASVAVAVGWVVQVAVVWILKKLAKYIKSDIYKGLVGADFFKRASRIIPAILFLILIQFTLTSTHSLSSWLSRVTWIYMIFIIVRSLSSVADVAWSHIDSRENKRRLPLRGLVQLVKGIIWAIGLIVAIGIILDKSPGTLLAGLGAFAAVLMLVFKDSILGLVAGVQLSENDSLHVGDWIKVNGTDANGTVLEVTLTTVKVLNWDKTITTVPPYTLVSGSFTNYRSMQLSKTRRIQRSYMIDADSVVECDENLLNEFSKLPGMSEWISKKREQKLAGKVEDSNNSAGLVNGSIETNLGVFRAYLQLYLNSHPRIAKDAESDCFVCTLAQTPYGIPLQIYCFTNTSAWIEYEGIQSSIMEHISLMLNKFHLYTYEEASGRDTVIEGYLSAGKSTTDIIGIPYPYYQGISNPENPGMPPVAPASTK